MSGRRSSVTEVLLFRSLEIQSILKIFHWQTKKYSYHVESGKLYEKLDELIDKYIETYSGGYIEESALKFEAQYDVTVHNIDTSKLKDKLREFERAINWVTNEIQHALAKDSSRNSRKQCVDLMTIRDEIIQVINQFRFLLSMS